MSNKYSRHQSMISRQSDESIGEDHWLKQFQKSLQKGAVQPKSKDSSLFDQISSIMNGKSKYPSVAAAVQDMQERSGLTAYLDKVSKTSEEGSKKVASDNLQVKEKKSKEPAVFIKCPQIKVTLENRIKDTKGNLSVPAIIDKLRSIHQNDIANASDWDDENLIREVSKRNLKAKSDNPDSYVNYSNLGTRDMDSAIDASNTDAFNSLVPAR